jgi:hypothetical protein
MRNGVCSLANDGITSLLTNLAWESKMPLLPPHRRGLLRVLGVITQRRGVSASRDRRDALQGDGFEHILAISVWEAIWFVIGPT